MNPSDVAQRLRWLVQASGKKANRLSKAASLDRTYLRLIIAGERTAFGAAPMAALAQLFGVDLDWLLLGNGAEPDADAVRRHVLARLPEDRDGEDDVEAEATERGAA